MARPPSANVVSLIYRMVAIRAWVVSSSSVSGRSTDGLNSTGALKRLYFAVSCRFIEISQDLPIVALSTRPPRSFHSTLVSPPQYVGVRPRARAQPDIRRNTSRTVDSYQWL